MGQVNEEVRWEKSKLQLGGTGLLGSRVGEVYVTVRWDRYMRKQGWKV